jgi:tRNA pseudouridine32 synthase/23S rRNA pseudouridine746 synthase
MLHLHARAVTIPLYKNKDAIEVTAPMPDHMRQTLEAHSTSGVLFAD